MRIALNLVGYHPGCGGVETYVVNLLTALQEVDRENRYLVVCDETAASSLQLTAPNFRMKTVAFQRHSLKGMVRGALLRIGAPDLLAWGLSGIEADVMHHPLTILNPPGLSIPSVLTFHDMQHEFFPEFFSPRELRQRNRTYRASVAEATAVIALTAHSKGCLVDRYHAAPDKIHVVHSGCGAEFTVREPSELAEVRSACRLERPFLYYPAATWPHKNHRRLFEAVRLLRDRGLFDGEVLLTGVPMNGHGDVEQSIGELGLAGTVRWLGQLPPQAVPGLYNLARLMVFPSLYEGFGLPVVEAMASGCPVVCSRQGALPDVGEGAVTYFDPLDVEDMAAKIALLWNDGGARLAHRRQGLLRAGRFWWENTARGTLAVYRRAAAAQMPPGMGGQRP